MYTQQLQLCYIMKHFSRSHGKALHGLGMRIVAGIISGNRESCFLVEQLQSFRESRPATGPCLETHPDPAKTQQKKKKGIATRVIHSHRKVSPFYD